MPITADIKVNGEKTVMENLDKARRVVETEKGRKMEQASIYLMNYIQRKKLSGDPLKRRTGNLVRAMNYNVTENNGDVVGKVGNRMVYSAIHETGGTIKAKKGKYLTIPLPAAMTPAGVLRKPARQWENTFVRGKVIFQRRGEKNVPLFVLKESVDIPARPYISTSLKETRDRIIKIIGEIIQTAVKVGNGQ